jgi:hypothetical protein
MKGSIANRIVEQLLMRPEDVMCVPQLIGRGLFNCHDRFLYQKSTNSGLTPYLAFPFLINPT